MGLVDEIVPEGKLREGALAFARKVLAEKLPLKKVRDNDKVEAARGKPEIFAEFRKANARKFRGFLRAGIQSSAASRRRSNLPFDEGLKTRARAVHRTDDRQTQSAAQRYVFFAERQVWKIARRARRHADAFPSTRSASSAPAPWAAASR